MQPRERERDPARERDPHEDLEEERRLRRRAEAERDLFRQLLFEAPAIVCVKEGPEHVTTFQNPEHHRLFGGRDVLGKPVREAQPELADQGVIDILDEVYRTGESFAANELRLRLDGAGDGDLEERVLNLVILPVREDRRVNGVALLAVDVTELVQQREEAEAVTRRARESEERFRLLIECVEDTALFSLDREGRVDSWNSGAERIKGYRADEILGRHFSVFYLPEAAARGEPERQLERARRGEWVHDEGWRVRKGGERFWSDHAIKALQDAEGSHIGFAVITRDITERRRDEAERARLVRELKRAIQVRDEFLSIASHELKTPLTSLHLQLHSLLRGAREGALAGDRLERKIREAARHLDRLGRLIDRLLDISRITSGRLELTPQDLDLVDVMKAAVRSTQAEARASHSEVILHVDGPVRGTWDRARVEQIISSLIQNALKYGGGKPVEVHVERTPATARVTVRDHGIGIAAKDQARVFRRFERAVPEQYGGLGLGLWIVRELLDAMGGSIRLDSKPGHGSTFVVELPLDDDPAPEARRDRPGPRPDDPDQRRR